MSLYLMAPTFRGVVAVEATPAVVVGLRRWMRCRLLWWWTMVWRGSPSGCGGVRGNHRCVVMDTEEEAVEESI
ncbi:hypothetical protein S83_010751 [Arachis hypogaea]